MTETRDLETWVSAFIGAFSDVSPRTLGDVRFRAARSLPPDLLVVVYEDWERHVTARAFPLAELEQLAFASPSPRAVARHIVVGDLIEPSAHGRVLDHDLVKNLNAEFPGLEWIGHVPL
ncbi:hypothetical protein [Arthrobacter cavernae]|uniref:Uncharacterized protein n=1 Tax=Arthrobacter cavernae TaxID=2817681 RepID=A0A939HK21_9MICC|nr:hypothetical protein [Arthrobacter cavernae]MBO1268835.1 hypothetical protein [Arthrobacter cavernae]